MWTSGQARAAAAREPLDAAAVRAAVVRPDGLWRAVEVTELTGSTNADLLALAAAGSPEGRVLAAEQQSAGRGRLGRAWVAPPRAALTFSLLLRPRDVPRARHGWLPLLAGLATAEAVRAVTRVDARLKWPNDVLAGEGKFGGILAEATADAVVIGIGLNVSTEPGELPPPAPGSLAATSLRPARTGARFSPRSWGPSSAGTARGPAPLVIPNGPACVPTTPACARPSAGRSGWSCPAAGRSAGWPPGWMRTAGCWSAPARAPRCR